VAWADTFDLTSTFAQAGSDNAVAYSEKCKYAPALLPAGSLPLSASLRRNKSVSLRVLGEFNVIVEHHWCSEHIVFRPFCNCVPPLEAVSLLAFSVFGTPRTPRTPDF
jgi:hypothetical protein